MRTFIVVREEYQFGGGGNLSLNIYKAESLLDLLTTLVGNDPFEETPSCEEEAIDLFEESNGDGVDFYIIAELRGEELISLIGSIREEESSERLLKS